MQLLDFQVFSIDTGTNFAVLRLENIPFRLGGSAPQETRTNVLEIPQSWAMNEVMTFELQLPPKHRHFEKNEYLRKIECIVCCTE